MNQFSAGPWKVNPEDPSIVMGATGKQLADTRGVEGSYFYTGDIGSQQTRHATAKLIAQAPSMYRILLNCEASIIQDGRLLNKTESQLLQMIKEVKEKVNE